MIRIEDLFPDSIDYVSYVKQHSFQCLLKDNTLIDEEHVIKKPAVPTSINPDSCIPLPAEYDDLCRLHFLCRSRKVSRVMEFGVGKSTIILTAAISSNCKDYGEYLVRNLRTSQPLEVHSIDNYESWISKTRDAMPKELAELNICHLHHSRVVMGTFSDRICTYYDSLPNITADLVYIDGPDQYSAVGDVRGISTRHRDRLPMSADLLAMEHFFEPGTLVVVDGRTANARFLAKNLQRNWAYLYVAEWDQHFFELQETPLGYWNKRRIEFCLGQPFFARMNKV